MKGKISSDYDTKYSVFVYRENCETIYFVLHFIITQHIENRCVEPKKCIGQTVSEFEKQLVGRRTPTVSHRTAVYIAILNNIRYSNGFTRLGFLRVKY
jgi:hypothetical protein